MYLADENFPIASVRLLRKAGLDVFAVVEEMPGATDAMILQLAEREYRIILTFDRDFGELIYRYQLGTPTGVVYFRYDPITPEEPGQHLLRLLALLTLQFESKFTVVDRDRVRQRLLSSGRVKQN